jgi:hypothetical protein
MRKLAIALLIILLISNMLHMTVFTMVSVGVKEGDWIEYQAVLTGSPPKGHEVTRARSEVVDVRGTVITLNVTTEFVDGALLNELITLNLETGQLGDAFIIPANLDQGDTFEDEHHGNITVSGVEEKSYAGASRLVVSATTAGSTYYWDKTTGVLVEGVSEFPDYSIHSLAVKTNMWESETATREDTIQYALLAAAFAVSVALIATMQFRRKNRSALKKTIFPNQAGV